MSIALERLSQTSTLGKNNFHNSYDAIVVLGAGVRRSPFRERNPHLYGDKDPQSLYLPTDLRHEDVFGLLGGSMRLLAAKELVQRKAAPIVVFTGGVSAKMQETLGPDVPAEALVYRNRFLRILEAAEVMPPRILIETQAVNTVGNLREVSRIIEEEQWGDVGLLTSDYHAPRATVLWRCVPKDPQQTVQLDVIGAETYLKEVAPGKYDRAIDYWYNSPAALRRLGNEEQGLRDFANGQYHPGEFQIVK